MQSVLMISSLVPGLLFVNGQVAGEVGPDAPIVRPVAPQGGVFLQHFPSAPGYLPLTRRITLSQGRPLRAAFARDAGMAGLVWPGGVVEMELFPEGIHPKEQAGVSPPDLPGAVREEDGTVRVLEAMDDVAGHALLVRYAEEDGAWVARHTEVLWAQGAPNWPRTPEQTALALAQALLLGLMDEARGYLAPGANLPELAGASAALPMAYPVPGASPCVGVVYPAGDALAQVCPLYYRAVSGVGTQGPWQLDELASEVPGAL